MDLTKLRAEFPQTDLEWRVQRSGIKGSTPWALVVPYITNRAIMDRLDDVCGPEAWRNEFASAPGGDGGVLCGIGIWCGGEWVTKYDGAERTNIEAVKGGLSAAMKRAAVQWGIGRYLYALEGPYFANFAEKGVNSDKIEGTYYRWNPPTLTEKPVAHPDHGAKATSEADKLYAENRKILDDKKLDGELTEEAHAKAVEWLNTQHTNTAHSQQLARKKLDERFAKSPGKKFAEDAQKRVAPKDETGADAAFGEPDKDELF